jgi:hypothetical protein
MFDFIDWIVLLCGSVMTGCAVADGLLQWVSGDTGNGLFMLALGLTGLATIIIVLRGRSRS